MKYLSNFGIQQGKKDLMPSQKVIIDKQMALCWFMTYQIDKAMLKFRIGIRK